MSLPVITVVGNLKRIEQKFLSTGKELTKFQVECSEKNSKGEWENLYISGEVWEKSSVFFNQYFKEGSVAIVTGKLVTNVYEKTDGTKVYENKFLFPQVSFAPREKEAQQSQSQYKPQVVYERQEPKLPEIDITDSIPF